MHTFFKSDSVLIDDKGKIALSSAAQSGNNEAVKFLLQQGANPFPPYYSPLHLAAQHGHIDVVETLLKHKVSVDTLLGHETPLLCVCYNSKTPLENTKMVDFLLQNGADPNFSTEYSKMTPLHYAVTYENADIVKLLLAHKANTNTQTSRGETPLYYAIKAGRVDLAEMLLENGAKLDKISGNSSALEVACRGQGVKHSAKMVELLLQHGADPNRLDENGRTPLYYAIQKNRMDLVEILLDRGAKPDTRLFDGQTALFHACGSTGLPFNPKIIELLLKYESNLTLSDQHGLTILHWAVLKNDKAVVELLLNHNTKSQKPLEINKKTNNGNTALHVASGVGTTKPNPEIVELLLQKGADPNITNKKGETALAIAKKQDNRDIIATFLKYKADL